MADPQGDLSHASTLLTKLSALLQTPVILGPDVTRQAFLHALSTSPTVHFQGHAVHNSIEPLLSHLQFADTTLGAGEIFELPVVKANLLALAACESASSVVSKADEPLGLIPSFLTAGTRTLVAALWRVNQKSAASLMDLFYSELRAQSEGIGIAEALRRSMLHLQHDAMFSAPYHWAPYTLNGDWCWRQ